MKARTRFHKAVVKANSTIKKPSAAIIKWANNIFVKKAVLNLGGRISCLECGHQWKNRNVANSVECPSCKSELDINRTQKRVFDQNTFFEVITSRGDFQIVRLFLYRESYISGKPKIYNLSEEGRFFISPIGKNFATEDNYFAIVGKYKASIFNNGYSGNLELRKKERLHRYDFDTDHQYPRISLSPFYKRIDRLKDKPISVYDLIKLCLPEFETLYKADHFLFDDISVNSYQSKLKPLWPSIKILMRNGAKFEPKDWITWCDYIPMLKRFGKDVRNMKYIFPKEGVEKAHNRYLKKIEDIRKKERIEALLAKIQDSEKTYKKEKLGFFGLCFAEGEIEVSFIDSVRQIYEDSRKLKHCAFEMKYHMKEKSLLFRALVDGELMETIEVEENKGKFVLRQSQGRGNKPTAYSNRIRKLIIDNMDSIMSANLAKTHKMESYELT